MEKWEEWLVELKRKKFELDAEWEVARECYSLVKEIRALQSDLQSVCEAVHPLIASADKEEASDK